MKTFAKSAILTAAIALTSLGGAVPAMATSESAQPGASTSGQDMAKPNQALKGDHGSGTHKAPAPAAAQQAKDKCVKKCKKKSN